MLESRLTARRSPRTSPRQSALATAPARRMSHRPGGARQGLLDRYKAGVPGLLPMATPLRVWRRGEPRLRAGLAAETGLGYEAVAVTGIGSSAVAAQRRGSPWQWFYGGACLYGHERAGVWCGALLQKYLTYAIGVVKYFAIPVIFAKTSRRTWANGAGLTPRSFSPLFLHV